MTARKLHRTSKSVAWYGIWFLIALAIFYSLSRQSCINTNRLQEALLRASTFVDKDSNSRILDDSTIREREVFRTNYNAFRERADDICDDQAINSLLQIVVLGVFSGTLGYLGLSIFNDSNQPKLKLHDKIVKLDGSCYIVLENTSDAIATVEKIVISNVRRTSNLDTGQSAEIVDDLVAYDGGVRIAPDSQKLFMVRRDDLRYNFISIYVVYTNLTGDSKYSTIQEVNMIYPDPINVGWTS